MFESGLWLTCDSSPEYLFSYNEVYLEEPYAVAKEWLRMVPVACIVFGGILFILTVSNGGLKQLFNVQYEFT